MSSVLRDLKNRYHTEWSPERFLEEFMIPTDIWESFLTTKLHEAIQSGKINGPRGIDIGCGPTIHRMAILGRVCDELVACDYVEGNTAFIKCWLQDEKLDVAYHQLLKFVAQLEGTKSETELTERVRSKLKDVIPCDVTSFESVRKIAEVGGLFDCAVSNGCLEAACLTYDSYVDSLRNVASLLKPGGAFILGGYFGGNFYVVNSVKYEYLQYDQAKVRQALEESGFTVDSFHLKTEDEANGKHLQSNSKGCFFSVSYKN